MEGSRGHDGTATGGSTTTIVDSSLANNIYANDYFNNWEITNQTKGFSTFVTDFVQSTGTFTIPTNTASAASDVYELHNRAAFLTKMYNDAIDLAIQSASHASALSDVVSQAIAFQQHRNMYNIPTTFRYINKIWVDKRDRYLAINPSANFDTLTGLKDASARTKIAQSFKVTGANPAFLVGDVYLELAKVGSPTGSLTLTIESDSSSFPDGTALLTSSTVSAADLTVNPTYVRFTFTAQTVLAENTTYWLVLASSDSVSSSNYVVWANDSTEAGYGDGSAAKYSGSAWSAVTGDFIFTVRSPDTQFEYLKPMIHYQVVRDTTRKLVILPAGMEVIGDGEVLYIQGQGTPSLPSADSTTVDVPYDYVVARAGIEMIPQNRGWFSGGTSQNLESFWAKKVGDLEPKLRTYIKPGSLEVEPL